MEKITFDGMRNFIIENELTDSVAITLHPDSFDELVMDYLDFNNNQIERWNIDLQDVDCVLRIVSSSLNHTQVIELITNHGYECAELI